MLELAKDYVPYDVRHPEQKAKKENTHTNTKTQKATKSKSGLPSTTLYAPTKRNRAIKILGRGDVFEGLRIYENIIKKLQHSFDAMCHTLDNTPRGFDTFDSFMGARKSFTYGLMQDVAKKGICRYQKVSKVHHMLKQFHAFKILKNKPLAYLPMEKRVPLTRRFIIKYYWNEKMTTGTIADALIVPEVWVQKEVTRLGLQKRKNGIRLRGRKGYVMPEEEKVKHRKQPHARAVVQICPKSFKVLRKYGSTGAVSRDGWNRENVRKAIKSAGMHDGFLWSYEGKEADIINAAKAKGDINKKLKLRELGVITKEQLQELYIDQNMTAHQVANILGCHPCTVGTKAMKFGLKKRTPKISIDELKHLYLDKGMQAKEIALLHGYSTKSISTYLCRNNITRKGHNKP